MALRAEALSTLEEGGRALASLFAKLSPGEMEEPKTIGGGDWSAKDLMGHIAAWEELAAEALTHWRAGRRPPVEDTFARGAEGVDELNARNRERTAAETLAAVRARAEAAHAGVVSAIGSIGDEEWTGRAPYRAEKRTTLVAMLGSILGAPKRPFGHAFAHLHDLEAYVASLGR